MSKRKKSVPFQEIDLEWQRLRDSRAALRLEETQLLALKRSIDSDLNRLSVIERQVRDLTHHNDQLKRRIAELESGPRKEPN